jgi:hypothetical protein
MELSGKLYKVGVTVQISEKFSKRVFVIETTDGMYPQKIEVELTQDKCSLLDGFSEGDNVIAKTNLLGREWTSPQGEVKFFNKIECWAINRVGTSTATTANQPAQAQKPQVPLAEVGADDGLPF